MLSPLSYVNVIAKPVDVTKNQQFSITDDDGYNKLELNNKLGKRMFEKLRKGN